VLVFYYSQENVMDKSENPARSKAPTSKRSRTLANPHQALPAAPGANAPVPAEAVQAAKRRYLISAVRGQLAKKAGIKPMSAQDMDDTLACMPGVSLIKTLQAPAGSHLMSASNAGEAGDTYVVSMDEAAAAVLQQTAPPHILIEEDAALDYGEMRKAEFGELAPQAFMDSLPAMHTFVLQVTDHAGGALAGVPVTLRGDGFPSSGITDDNGQVQLNILLQQGKLARSLTISPSKDFWNRKIEQPQLKTGRINVVPLFGLSDPLPGGQRPSQANWGAKLMGIADGRIGSGRGVRIAVIDSGTDNSHPQLHHVRHGCNFTDASATEAWNEDLIGHGSHCTGVIGARASENAASSPVLGLAPDAEIHSLKIFPGGSLSSLIEALDYCIAHQVDIANLSLGTEKISLSVEQKLEEAALHGVACIVATGNSGGNVLYPAASPFVLAVSALGLRSEIPPGARELSEIQAGLTNAQGLFIPHFSCFGPQVGVCAPGVGIVSTVPGMGLRPDSGTSMAAPHISGLAAGLLSDPEIAPLLGPRGADRVARLFELIRSLCTPVLSHDPTNHCGAGLPQLANLNRLLPHR